MKEDVLKIIEMNKAGTITDAQAAQLIEELAESNATSARKTNESPRFGFRAATSSIASVIHESIQGALANTLAPESRIFPGDEFANAMNMSQVDSPSGSEMQFRGNTISMSKLSDFSLERARLVGNNFSAARIKDLQLVDSTMSENQISASSLDDVNLRNATLEKNRIMGTKLRGINFDKAHFSGCDWNGTTLKDVTFLDETQWSNASFNGVTLTDVTVRGGRAEALQFSGVVMKDTSLIACTWSTIIARGIKWNDVEFKNCRFDDVLFAGGDGGWLGRTRGFYDTRFENCELSKVLFSECMFSDVVIRNVNLTDIRVQKVTLSDVVIDGNEAFFRACGLKPQN